MISKSKIANLTSNKGLYNCAKTQMCYSWMEKWSGNRSI